MNISVFEVIKKFIFNKKYYFSKSHLHNLGLYISIYLDISYDRVKNENYYEPLTNNFINFNIGVDRILWVLHNTHKTINNSSFFSYDMYILLNCLRGLGGKKKGFSLDFFWSLLNLVKQINRDHTIYFDKLALLYIDFFINIVIGKRKEIWDKHLLQHYKNNLLDKELKKFIDFSSIENKIFKFFIFEDKPKFTLVSIDYKSKWIKTHIEKLGRFKEKRINNKVFSECIKEINKRINIIISPKQKILFKNLLTKPYFVQGIAGTGKSFLLCCLALYFSKLKENSRCVLLSFTGKAVSVLNTKLKYLGIYNIKIEARTIHSELARLNNTNEKNKIIYLVDESSFISTDLMYELLSRAPIKFITFVGDLNQLPPIDLGNPFRSIVKTNKQIINVITLDTCYREEKKNRELIVFKKSILNNNKSNLKKFIKLNNGSTTRIEVLSSEQDTKNEIMKKLYDYCNYHKKIIYKFNNYKMEKIEESSYILNNRKVFLVATNELRKYLNAIIHNEILKINKNVLVYLPINKFKENSFFNKNGLPITIGTRLIYRGSNKYRNKKIYIANGETCIVTNIDFKNNNNLWKVKLTLLFNEFKKQTYKFSYIYKKNKNKFSIKFNAKEINILSNFILAYVLTIHSSQGSEYNDVVTIFNFKDLNRFDWGNKVGINSFYTKNLIYTAISRAKEKLILLIPTKMFLFNCLSKKNDLFNNYMDYLLSSHFKNKHTYMG